MTANETATGTVAQPDQDSEQLEQQQSQEAPEEGKGDQGGTGNEKESSTTTQRGLPPHRLFCGSWGPQGEIMCEHDVPGVKRERFSSLIVCPRVEAWKD